MRHEDQIAECLRHSDIVFNLVGRDYETKFVSPLSLKLPSIHFSMHLNSETSTTTLSMRKALKRLHELQPRIMCLALFKCPT